MKHYYVYLLLFARPTFHHFFHKLAEHGIHSAVHHVKYARLLTARVKFLPDATMIVLLILLDLVIEHLG